MRRGPRSARGRARVRVPLGRLLLVAASLLLALAGLHVLLDGLAWYYPVAALVVLALLATTVARAAGLRAGLPPLLGALAAGAGIVAGFAPGTAVLGVIPTGETWERLGELLREGFASIGRQGVPATADAGIVLLLALLAVVLAVLAESSAVGLRHPALAVPAVLVLLGVPVVVRPGLVDAAIFLATGALLLLLLRLPRPRSTPGATAVVGVLALVAALVVPPVAMPDPEPRGPGTGYSTGINPLVSLGRDLRRDEAVLAASYTTEHGGGAYLRLSVLPVFSGQGWRPGDLSERGVLLEEAPFPRPVGQGEGVGTVPRRAELELGSISSRWLPVPYAATDITGLEGEWLWEPDGLSVRTPSGNAFGQRYTVDYEEPLPSVEQLRAAPEPGPALERELALPAEVPGIITSTAREVAGDAGTDYDAALALQRYLRGPDFEYSTETPLDRAEDGADLEVVAAFLEERSGYCVHFAATMAIMARSLGIPSRLVVGFQQGTETEVELEDGTTTTRFEVTTHDLHAWPELYFEDVGWTRFEPTPGRGSLPVYPETLEEEAEADPADAPLTPAEPGIAPDASGRPVDLPEDRVPDGIGDAPAGDGTALPVVAGFSLAVLLLALATPAAWRAGRRALRLRRIRLGRGIAEAAWSELRDTARDVGWAAPASETPRELAARLGIVLSEEGLDELRDLVERAAFAEPGRLPPDLAARVEARLRGLRRAILSAAEPRARARALLLPPSLLAAVLGDGREGLSEVDPAPAVAPR